MWMTCHQWLKLFLNIWIFSKFNKFVNSLPWNTAICPRMMLVFCVNWLELWYTVFSFGIHFINYLVTSIGFKLRKLATWRCRAKRWLKNTNKRLICTYNFNGGPPYIWFYLGCMSMSSINLISKFKSIKHIHFIALLDMIKQSDCIFIFPMSFIFPTSP